MKRKAGVVNVCQQQKEASKEQQQHNKSFMNYEVRKANDYQ